MNTEEPKIGNGCEPRGPEAANEGSAPAESRAWIEDRIYRRLYVKEIRSGSVIAEVVAYAAATLPFMGVTHIICKTLDILLSFAYVMAWLP